MCITGFNLQLFVSFCLQISKVSTTQHHLVPATTAEIVSKIKIVIMRDVTIFPFSTLVSQIAVGCGISLVGGNFLFKLISQISVGGSFLG